MSSISHPKYQASLSVEEFIQVPDSFHQQKWLLTYIDVFVLIIMLVLTLLALSNFESEQKEIKQTVVSEIVKQSPAEIESQLISTGNPPLAIDNPTPSSSPAQATIVKAKVKSEHSKEQPSSAETTTESILQTQKEAEDKPIVKNKTEQNLVQNKNNSLQLQLQKTVDELGLTDSINMKVSLGYAQLEIQDKVLFQSSEANLLTAGKSLLKKLAPLLKKSSGLIYIEGHTDNRPITTARFPSNWELGSSRATSVLHFLSSQELETSRLRAITYGDTKPIADNTSAEGREKNRRVSLVIKVSDKID